MIGSTGLCGKALTEQLQGTGVDVVGTSRRPLPSPAPQGAPVLGLDLSRPPSEWVLPDSIGVAYVCAARAGLEECERWPGETRQINVDATGALVDRLVERGAFVVYLSSNRVFDGSRPHVSAADATCPVTEYGRQKECAEQRVLSHGGRAAVVRLTKVLSRPHALFESWRRDLEGGATVHPFVDLSIAPVSVPFTVEAIERVGARNVAGITQVSSSEDLRYQEVAARLAVTLGVRANLVQPVLAADRGVASGVAVPYTSLDTSSLAPIGLTAPDPWEAISFALGQ